ncbi:hypothetical protein SHDE107825_11420 [Shewanella denitrificans]|jgi:hypothetical protein
MGLGKPVNEEGIILCQVNVTEQYIRPNGLRSELIATIAHAFIDECVGLSRLAPII